MSTLQHDAENESLPVHDGNADVLPPQPKKRKLRKEGALPVHDEGTSDVSSDETWSPSSNGDDEEEVHDQPPPPPQTTTRQLRSKGPVTRPGDEMHAIMDKIDEVVDNESDFSSTTESEEEEDDESSENDEEEEDESDTEEDGYSDDDSFVTSGEEDEDEDEVTVPVPYIDTSNAPILDPITTDELLADFPDAPANPTAVGEYV